MGVFVVAEKLCVKNVLIMIMIENNQLITLYMTETTLFNLSLISWMFILLLRNIV